MKIEQTSEGFHLFLNNIYFKDVDWNEKTSIEENVRGVFVRIKNNFKVKLRGFYKIKIYPNRAGVFMDIKKIDDDNYDGSEINFRIIVMFNKDMYLKMDDCFYIDDDCEKIFYRNSYYVNLEAIENILGVVDFGDVVLEDELDFEECIFLTKKDYF